MNLRLLLFVFVFGALLENCAALNSLSTSSQSLNSVSTSLNSISNALNSVSSVSKSLASISTSSGSDDDKKSSLYIQDVESITYLFLMGKIESWEESMELTAHKYGYLTWKENPNSFLGIGRGFKKAELSKLDFQYFLKNLSNKNLKFYKFLNLGYNS